jgi:hypothetical protein
VGVHVDERTASALALPLSGVRSQRGASIAGPEGLGRLGGGVTRPLEDPSLVFLIFRDGRLCKLSMPPVGGEIALPRLKPFEAACAHTRSGERPVRQRACRPAAETPGRSRHSSAAASIASRPRDWTSASFAVVSQSYAAVTQGEPSMGNPYIFTCLCEPLPSSLVLSPCAWLRAPAAEPVSMKGSRRRAPTRTRLGG